MRPFKCGWFGDGGLGERMIQEILAGRKTATVCPAYDPEDAEFQPGDLLTLTDKNGKVRASLLIRKIELRPWGAFDEALAARQGMTLAECVDNMNFANGRALRPDEEMRIVHFELVPAAAAVAR